MYHGIIYEPDQRHFERLETLLKGLEWRVGRARAADHFEALVADGAWAGFIAVLDLVDVLARITRLRNAGDRGLLLFALLDAPNALQDRQLRAAGADGVFVRPAPESALVDAIVQGMLRRRR